MKQISFENLKKLYEKELSKIYDKEITIPDYDFINDMSNSDMKNYKEIDSENSLEEREIEMSNHKGKIDFFRYFEKYNEVTYDITYYID